MDNPPLANNNGSGGVITAKTERPLMQRIQEAAISSNPEESPKVEESSNLEVLSELEESFEAAESSYRSQIRTNPSNKIRDTADLLKSKTSKRFAKLESQREADRSHLLSQTSQIATPPFSPSLDGNRESGNEIRGLQDCQLETPCSHDQDARRASHNLGTCCHSSDVLCPKFGDHIHVPIKKKARKANAEHGERKVAKRLKMNPADRGNLDALRQINTLINNLANASSEDHQNIFSQIRYRLYKMEHYYFVNKQIIEDSRVLNPKQGLPRLFTGSLVGTAEIPRDIQSDARALHRRWFTEEYDWSLFRGVRISHLLKTKGLIRDFEKANESTSNYEGEGKLYNGQWWPNRLCLVRDGAHGASEAGIYGTDDKGALAVVVAERWYCDVDHGETLYYCSTEGKEDGQKIDDGTIARESETENATSTYRMSKGAKQLFRACELDTKIRVIRSSKLAKTNIYRPKEGLRYDGLYSIKEGKALDLTKHIYRFKLVRVDGQDPIRFEGESVRPSFEELQRLEYWQEHQRGAKALL